MSEVNRTPGPWALNESDGTIRSQAFTESDQMGDYKGVIVCDLAPAVNAWPTVGRKYAEPEARANAALICAAPDLLAVAMGYLRWESDLVMCDRAWQSGGAFPTLTPELWDRLLELQSLRNAAIKRAEGAA